MFIILAIVMLSLFALLIVHTGAVIWRWLRGVGVAVKPLTFSLIYGVPVALVLAAFLFGRRPDSAFFRFLAVGSHYALGVFVYLLLFVNLVALGLFIGRLVKLIKAPRSFSVSLTALILSGVLVVGLSAYGMIQARTVKTVQYTISVDGDGEELKIALISDLHIGYVIDETYLAQVVEVINGMKPDLVCIAGDVFDGDMAALADPAAVQAVLRSIDAPYGVYACLGNHDAGDSYDGMVPFLTDAGIHVLQDAYTVVDDRVLLVGRRDSSPIGGHGDERQETVALPAENTLPVVVLDHQPGNFPEYGEGVDLVLSGHTHRGQLFPVNLINEFIHTVNYGYYRESDTSPQLIVTSGIGTWGPVMRLGSQSEVVEILLR